jgi:hypothetical protein
MRDWLRGGVGAARLVADRADLWFPGAMVSFAAFGWLVLLGVVAAPPDEGDALYLGVRLATSPWWPWNAIVLLAALTAAVGALLGAVAFGEVALLMGTTDPRDGFYVPTVTRAMSILALAMLPVGALLALLLWLATPLFEAAYFRPDAEMPYLVAVLETAWPAVLLLLVVIVIVQAFGAAALRRPGRGGISLAWRQGARLIPQAAMTTGVFLGGQVATALVLLALWIPLGGRLADGQLSEPSTAVLLLGFIWIWLVLVILAGVVQAWISAWWTSALGPESGGAVS